MSMEPVWALVMAITSSLVAAFIFRWFDTGSLRGIAGKRMQGAAADMAASEGVHTAAIGVPSTRVTYGTLVGIPVAFFLSRTALTAADLWYSLQGVRQQALVWLASPWLWLLLLVVGVAGASVLIRRSCLTTRNARVLLVASVIAIATIGAVFPTWHGLLRAELSRYVMAQAQALNERGDYSAARSRFMGILTSPDLPDALRDDAEGRIGQALFRQGKYVEAIGVYAHMVEVYPKSDLRDAANTSIVWCIARMGRTSQPALALQEIGRLQAAHPRVTMINPIFLAAGPELWAAIQERPASPELHAPDFLTARERAAITYLVSESRGDANRETRAVGMFLLGRYEEAIATTRDGDTLSWALYHRADVAYAAGDISAARSGFSELLRRAPQTALADDAALRLGRCAELDGDVAGAIRQFEGGLRLPDGDRHKELEYRIALLTETCDPGTVDALAAAASPGASRPLIEGLYRRLLAVERFPEASAFIRRVDSAAAVVPSSDVEIGLALERAASNGSRADVAVADLFASHQKVLYNSAWGNGRATYVHTIDVRMSVAGTGGVAPNGFIEGVNDYRSALTPEYFAQQNALSHAAARYRRYLSRSWDAAVASKLVSIEARLAYTGSFVYDESVRTASRASALEVYGLLDADRAVDMEVKADAADAIAQVGLQGPGRYAYEQVISDYTTLVRRYPKSHLANNALKRIGWCLEELAGEADPGSGEFLAAYRNAAAAYRRILVEYPGGHVAREAQDRLSEIEGVLYAWQ